MLYAFERKTVRRMYDTIQQKGHWRPTWNSDI